MAPQFNESNAPANPLVRRIGFPVLGWLAKPYNLTLVMVVLFAFAVLQALNMLNAMQNSLVKPYEQRERTWMAQVDNAKRYAEVAEELAAARQDRIKKLEKDVSFLKARIPNYDLTDSLRSHVDSLFWTLSDSAKAAYAIIPQQRLVILRQDTTIRVQRVLIAKQDTSLAQKDTLITTYKSAKDSLYAVLTSMPTRPPKVKIFGLIPAPSRRMSYVLGIASGAVLSAKLVR